MITAFLLSFVVMVLNMIFSWLPAIEELPFGIDEALTTVFSTWNAFLEFMWPFQILWTATLIWYGFLLLLLALKFFLGNRAPN